MSVTVQYNRAEKALGDADVTLALPEGWKLIEKQTLVEAAFDEEMIWKGPELDEKEAHGYIKVKFDGLKTKGIIKDYRIVEDDDDDDDDDDSADSAEDDDDDSADDDDEDSGEDDDDWSMQEDSDSDEE